jgi:flagellin
MPLTLGSNIVSLKAQRRLNDGTSELGKIFERLASGQRINRASDDAAGLAVADKLRTDGRLYTQSIANINDGISAINVLDGSLEQRGGILQRLTELAEQASNGSFSTSQRGSLGDEYRELLREMARIRESTNFNGLDLLDPNSRINLQVGINGGTNSRLSLDGIDLGNSQWVLDTSTMTSLADFDQNGGIDAGDRVEILSYNDGTTLAALQVKFGNNWTTTTAVDDQGQERTVFIGAMMGINGIEFLSFTSSADGSSYTGNNVNWATFEVSWEAGNFGKARIQSNRTVSDGLGGNFEIDAQLLRLSDSGASSPASLLVSSIDSIYTARASLDALQEELATLAQQRGKLGATESRLRVTLSLAAVARENSASAEGRIRDADIASESANLIRKQISQQAAVNVLAQANQQPALALQLLR